MLYEHFNTGLSGDCELFLCDRDEDLKPGVTYGPVVRDLFVIECCTSGRGGVSVNDRYFPIVPGDCIVLQPGDVIKHFADEKDPRSGVWCAFDGIEVAKLVRSVGISSIQPYAPKEAFEAVERVIETMIVIKNDRDPGASLRRRALVNELLGELMRYAGEKAASSDHIRRALQMIEAGYFRPMNATSLADEVGLERSYFSSLFRRETGTSPYQYLTRYRLKKACLLMTRQHCGVAQAAEAVGLPPESFSRVFRREYHMTPGEYVRTHAEV